MSRRNKSNFPILALLVLVVIAGIVFMTNPFGDGNTNDSGDCDPDPDRKGYCLVDPGAYDAAVFVVGNTQNSPSPDIFLDNSEFDDILKNVFYSDNIKNVKLVSVAGDNHTLDFKASSGVAKNINASRNNLNKVKKELEAAMTTPADASGADYMSAILKASKLLPKSAENPLIIVIGSGYSDTGVLDFAHDDVLTRYGEDQTKLENYLAKQNQISRASLEGKTIIWYGLGEVVAPQKDMSEYSEQTASIYEATLNYLGATELSLDNPIGITKDTKSVDSSHLVAQTFTSALTAGDKFEVNEKIGEFKPDLASLKNPDLTRNKLQNFSKRFKASKNLKLKITGYIATCADDNSLSLERAKAIRDLLVELGIDKSQISVDGKAGGPPEKSGKEFLCPEESSLPDDERRTVIIEVLEN